MVIDINPWLAAFLTAVALWFMRNAYRAGGDK